MTAETPTASSPIGSIGETVEGLAALDAPGKKVAKAVRDGIGKPGTFKDLLSGTWLGHALHPLLTDVVIGTWTSATLLDLVGGKDTDDAARKLIGLGIAAYGPTALTGVTDWADAEPADDGVRRVGLVHAATNATALTFYAASLLARRRGDRGRGVALGLVGAGAMSVGGYLGSHLIARQGIGVDQTTFDPGSPEWVDVLADQDLGTAPTAVQAGDAPVVLVRRPEGGIAALHDRCNHRGCSLASQGEVEGDAITCSCHGSRFRLSDGALLRGPATAPQPAFEARERDGRIEVRALATSS